VTLAQAAGAGRLGRPGLEQPPGCVRSLRLRQAVERHGFTGARARRAAPGSLEQEQEVHETSTGFSWSDAAVARKTTMARDLAYSPGDLADGGRRDLGPLSTRSG